ncbi:hypothetical protein ACIA8G_26095 [Lentzea sp. NPDC051213]|uniref:hypothetical protein n=1 Tax=Lentzea sp. NPDC051213 TaxID=3364126 RepID=UPI00379F4FBE
MKYVLRVAAALALCAMSATTAASAPAEHDVLDAEHAFATVDLVAGKGWMTVPDPGNRWGTRGGISGQFHVDITNSAGHDERGLSVFVSLPTYYLDVTGYEGEDWNCQDVNDGAGAEGLRCTQNHLIVHEEAWPRLTVFTRARSEYYKDTIDVYADAGGHRTVHAGTAFLIDTST